MRLIQRLAVLLAALAMLAMVAPRAATAGKTPALVVVKVDTSAGATFEQVAADNEAVVVDVLIESRGIVVLSAEDSKGINKNLKKDDRIIWVDHLESTEAEDERFHAWPIDHAPTLNAQLGQGLASLELGTVHTLSTGAGVSVAVLDTGIDPASSGLDGVVIDRWDFIDDDDDPSDTGNGIDDDGDSRIDEAIGHGTHVAGIVHQVAPNATVLNYRVLDSDGRGNVYAVAEAIYDATAAGADIINLSFGMSQKLKASVMKDALHDARKAGVIVVAAAGNRGNDKKQYPAADKNVLGVTAYDDTSQTMPAFASHGGWVDVAAPGVGVASRLPGGRVAAWSGSSMATPVVAGQAALLLSVDGTLEPKHVEKAIRDSARKIDHKYGPKKGLVNLLDSFAELG